MTPGYLKMPKEELKERARRLLDLLSDCTVCPHLCHVNRAKGEVGFCRAPYFPVISDYGPHFGEERPLVGRAGSGTIFFSYCNMRCVYCQNHHISCKGEGIQINREQLAQVMLSLQGMGCHNINLVSPSHWVPQIVDALVLAREKGLNIPLVYNTGGYDRVEILRELEGIVDIYMPDIKYASEQLALNYSGISNYPEVAQAAVKEMYRQVGNLVLDEEGIARRGLLIRHLVLPEDIAGTEEVVKFIAQAISPETAVNIMDQYYPAHRARAYPPLGRRITRKEYQEALAKARRAGLTNLL